VSRLDFPSLKLVKPPGQRGIENRRVMAANPIADFRVASNMTGPVNI